MRQISSLVTPDRYLARTRASVKKEEVSTSYVHNLNCDERHASPIKHRAKVVPSWKDPHTWSLRRGSSVALSLASSLAGGMLNHPPAGPRLGPEVPAWGFGVPLVPGARACRQKSPLETWRRGAPRRGCRHPCPRFELFRLP